MIKKWELFSHDADIGIRGLGETQSQAFENAALALTSVIIDPAKVSSQLIIQLELEEAELDFLFFEWINHIIYEMDTKKMLFGQFEVNIHNHKLVAKMKGEEINKIKEDLGVEVKGATFTELKVVKEKENWIAQCVVDI